MPVATYLKDNDYSQIDFKPYELSYQAVLKEYATKQQYWLQGVAKVQSAWSGLTDLDPINTVNRENLKNFNEEAKAQFVKLGKSDLSLSDNQEQIKDVIKPLYDTNNPASASILYDSYTKKHYAEEFAKAEAYKTKDKGIQYAQDNERQLQIKAKESYFDLKDYNGKDLAVKMEEAYKNKNAYTPYYDPTKEIKDAIKDCPYNTEQKFIPGKAYDQTITNKERSASKLYDCISSMLSPKALTQLQISGFVKFYNSDGTRNLTALQDSYSADLQRQIKETNEEIIRIQGRIASGQLSKDEKQIQEKVIETLKNTKLTGLTSDLENSKNLDYINSNYEILSGYAWKQAIINQAASAYSSFEYKVDSEANPYELLDRKAMYDRANMEMQHQYDLELEKYKSDLKNPGGANGGPTQDYTVLDETNSQTKTLDYHIEVQTQEQNIKDLNVSEFSFLKQMAKERGLDTSSWTIESADYATFKSAFLEPNYVDINKDGKIDEKDQTKLQNGKIGYLEVPNQGRLSPQYVAIDKKRKEAQLTLGIAQARYNVVANNYKKDFEEVDKKLEKFVDEQLNGKSSYTFTVDNSNSSHKGNDKFQITLNRQQLIDYTKGQPLSITAKYIDYKGKVFDTPIILSHEDYNAPDHPFVPNQLVAEAGQKNAVPVIITNKNLKIKLNYGASSINILGDVEIPNQIPILNTLKSNYLYDLKQVNNKISENFSKKYTVSPAVTNISYYNTTSDDKAHPIAKQIAPYLGLTPKDILMESTDGTDVIVVPVSGKVPVINSKRVVVLKDGRYKVTNITAASVFKPLHATQIINQSFQVFSEDNQGNSQPTTFQALSIGDYVVNFTHDSGGNYINISNQSTGLQQQFPSEDVGKAYDVILSLTGIK